MTDKMVRFLKSIGIEELERFDLDFELLMKHPILKQTWDMVIVKETPWTYDLYREFSMQLHRVNYPYQMSFTYRKKPTGQDAIDLFEGWYATEYRKPFTLNYRVETNAIAIRFHDEQERLSYESCFEQFEALLSFLKYPIAIKKEIELVVETIDQKKIEALAKKIEEETKLDDPSFVDVDEAHLSRIEEAENQILVDYEQTLKAQAREEASRTFYKKGNYQLLPIKEIKPNSGNVEFEGMVCNIFKRDYGEKMFLRIVVASQSKGMLVTINEDTKELSRSLLEKIDLKVRVRIQGRVLYDDKSQGLKVFAHALTVLDPMPLRTDNAPEKRVELHLHSKMSTMDAVGAIDDYCALAKHMGHSAIALTDHGVVQGFPEAQTAAKKYGLKMIYGCEVYMVDDVSDHIIHPSDASLTQSDYVIFDLETTGLSSRYDRIIEFGGLRIRQGQVVDKLELLIHPGDVPIQQASSDISGITEAMLKGKPTFAQVAQQILSFMQGAILVSHNAKFDYGFLAAAFEEQKVILTHPVIDTLSLSRFLFAEASTHRLGALARRFDIEYDTASAHRAVYDAEVLSQIWFKMLDTLVGTHRIAIHKDLNNLTKSSALIKHMRSLHTTILVKNKTGLKALYALVSNAHLDNFADQPRTPRNDIIKHREHLLIGSACFNGEVFETAKTQGRTELLEVMKFYDFIEIQPLDNYRYLIDMGQIENETELKRILKEIIACAESLGKIVVATGDAHYVDPEDKIFRDVFIFAKGLKKANHPLNPYNRDQRKPFENPNQHFRSTEEMLLAFAWLGKDKAEQYVVKNTQTIAAMIDALEPVKNKLHKPTIANSEKNLQQICYENAKAQYGNPLPEIVKNRLDAELKGIVDNGYSVIYYVTSLIIKEARDQGHIVGSRGSVGSSFAATMAKITEVNPLPPHYYCPRCQFSDFAPGKQYKSGFDLPIKLCPTCGELLKGDGQNIPFETFLGFNANKVPDIDLNFPRDFQSIAHETTKKLLGNNTVYRAGTVETVAEKTAFGYAKGYYEKLGMDPNKVPYGDLAYLAYGCQGVRRTSGQHPGGMVVVPQEMDILDFTPIQYPADNAEAKVITTHFAFEALHETLLKFDMLGHVDPLAVKMMANALKVPVDDIPLNDPETLSLFASDAPLKRKEKYLSLPNGALGTPEFGTSLGISILKTINPRTFNHLVIISGLSHGTNVFNGNAKELIESKTANVEEVIGCRDDIMTYLIGKGIPPLPAFTIMERVRKGYKLTPELEEIMRQAKVPEYYIASCNKIKYLFPKAHAVAYVMMAVRVAWFKVHHPLTYYATFFSLRSKQYDLPTMLKGPRDIFDKLEAFKVQKAQGKKKLQPKDADIENTLTIALEMKERGYSILNIDLEKSDATQFKIDEAKQAILPPFIVLDGIGENAALSVVEARNERPFLSQEDLQKRTKLSPANIEDLRAVGALSNLEEHNQVSLFSFSAE